MARETYLESIRRCMGWITGNMLTFDYGYNGIYERIRINKRLRTNWVRPDCNAEIARVLALYGIIENDAWYEDLYGNISSWLLRTQDDDPLSAWYGTFPFFVMDGTRENLDTRSGDVTFQNDNGKVLLALVHLYRYTNDERLLSSAVKLADFWAGIQQKEGWFVRKDGRVPQAPQGPCFVLWLAAGLVALWKETGGIKYSDAARKAYDYVLSLMMENGRVKTSYELCKTEDWRPVSSEAAIALYSFSVAYQETGERRYADAAKKTAKFVLSLQHQSGGILNCDDTCLDAALQNNMELCDLVYTEGYALMALAQAWKATKNSEYKAAAEKLADFLARIQCQGESPLWDGGWRGSYNVKTGQWDGKADQNNAIDEGGMYSVYTGWCAAPIMYGMLMLIEE